MKLKNKLNALFPYWKFNLYCIRGKCVTSCYDAGPAFILFLILKIYIRSCYKQVSLPIFCIKLNFQPECKDAQF